MPRMPGAEPGEAPVDAGNGRCREHSGTVLLDAGIPRLRRRPVRLRLTSYFTRRSAAAFPPLGVAVPGWL